MRFFYILLFALLVVWGGLRSIAGAVQPNLSARQSFEPESHGTAGSPIGWKIADVKELFERNHNTCGIVTNQAFDFDEVTQTKSESTRGTPFAGAGDVVVTPTATRRSRHAPADYLWCDLGTVDVAGVNPNSGEQTKTRNIFVSKDGQVLEFLRDTRVIKR
jgi:hypothetical protein